MMRAIPREQPPLPAVGQVKDFQKWFEGQQATQAKKKPHEDPAFLSNDANAKLDAVRKVCLRARKSMGLPRQPYLSPLSALGIAARSHRFAEAGWSPQAQAFAKLKNTKKPKPPPPPANATANANGTSNGTVGNNTAADASSSKGDAARAQADSKAGGTCPHSGL